MSFVQYRIRTLRKRGKNVDSRSQTALHIQLVAYNSRCENRLATVKDDRDSVNGRINSRSYVADEVSRRQYRIRPAVARLPVDESARFFHSLCPSRASAIHAKTVTI